MQEQSKKVHDIKAEAALRILEQAWAYFTPEPRVVSTMPVYEDLPLAS
ncbi:hypothetical protein [Sagittula sp. S175]